MFLHNFKYEFLNSIRQKEVIFWLMCFPIILGTFFNMAFGNLYEKDEMFSEIPVAVVEVRSDNTFRTVMDELSSGDSPLFKAEYTDEEKANELLKNGDVTGIIRVDSELSLSVASNGLEPSIIKSFLEQYEAQKTIITDTAMSDPDKLRDVIEALSADIDCIETKELTAGNMDVYVQYFQNLIAMVALFGTISGLYAATSNQGNLSQIGARKCVSPTNKLKAIIANLLAAFCVQVICTFISITYIVFILKIDMGNRIPMIYLSGATGSLTGISLGFFIGSIGRVSEGAKIAASMSLTMFCCFLSGLMVGNMKAVVEQYCPIVNKLNPAAVISDLFYCLSIYDDYTRYMEKTATLLVMTFIFTAGGFLMTRRKKYASL